MGAPDLLRYLTSRGAGVTLKPNGNILVDPSTVLTDADRDEIRVHKSELVALLQRQQQIPPTRTTLAKVTPEEAARLLGYYELARDLGFGLDDAEHITGTLHARDRLYLDMAMCIECRHLNGRRCGVAAAGRMPSASRQYEPVRVDLIRCSWFKPRSGPGN